MKTILGVIEIDLEDDAERLVIRAGSIELAFAYDPAERLVRALNDTMVLWRRRRGLPVGPTKTPHCTPGGAEGGRTRRGAS